ncbi:MAG: DUF4878 domain-containing protein [Lentimicrobiaceae bacterium]|nr:DUF4878 domain-containing protein [Lentimicrobiaceae bacterium]
MKRLIVAVGVVGVVLFSSCANKGPEEVTKTYYTLLCKGEYDKLKDIVLEEHRTVYGLMSEIQKSEGKKENIKEKVEVFNVECKIVDDEAICSCLVKVGYKEPQREVLKLKKVDKKWLVDYGKENRPAGDEFQIMNYDTDEDDYGEIEDEYIDEFVPEE